MVLRVQTLSRTIIMTTILQRSSPPPLLLRREEGGRRKKALSRWMLFNEKKGFKKKKKPKRRRKKRKTRPNHEWFGCAFFFLFLLSFFFLKFLFLWVYHRSNRHAAFRAAQLAFKDLMIHRRVQFTLRIASSCVLHRSASQDIHCQKLCYLVAFTIVR